MADEAAATGGERTPAAHFRGNTHPPLLPGGFREESRIRQRVFHDGRYWDDIRMGITRDEFLQGQGRVGRKMAATPEGGAARGH